MDEIDRAALDWLLASDEAGIRRLTRIHLLDDPSPDDDPLDGPLVQGLLANQREDGGFGVHPYAKWEGAHWRLISLVELGLAAGHPDGVRAARTVLEWLTGHTHRDRIQVIDGLTRRCASQEGNALAVCSRLGLTDEPDVQLLAESLLGWQWPDGGWNCDKNATGRRSSFHETLPAVWGLFEYGRATGDAEAVAGARRAAELFLEHRLFRKGGTGEVINPTWTVLYYPPFWHYNILQALLVLSRMGLVSDPRCEDAVETVLARRRPDGRWQTGGRWWSPPGSAGSNVEVVDWGGRGPSPMLTLNALRVLRAADAWIGAA